MIDVARMREWRTLVQLIWWSLLLHASKHKHKRRRYRKHLVITLAQRLGPFEPDLERFSPVALSCWLGACLAARSTVRSPLRSTVARIAGRTIGVALVAAYLAWRWFGRDGNDISEGVGSQG